MIEATTNREIDALISEVNGQWIIDMEIDEADPDHPIVPKTIIEIEEYHHTESLIQEMIDQGDVQNHHIDSSR